jgi:hypothetical protein
MRVIADGRQFLLFDRTTAWLLPVAMRRRAAVPRQGVPARASHEWLSSRSALGAIFVNNVGGGKVRRIAALETVQVPRCMNSLGLASAYDSFQIATLRANLLVPRVGQRTDDRASMA